MVMDVTEAAAAVHEVDGERMRNIVMYSIPNMYSLCSFPHPLPFSTRQLNGTLSLLAGKCEPHYNRCESVMSLVKAR